MISKDAIDKGFKRILSQHQNTLEAIKSLDFKHQTLQMIRQSFADELCALITNISEDYKIVHDEIVWDHLVIGMFGETNAGKSTIIETLRLRYGADINKDWIHGEIVGTGEADYTKDAAEYELSINGKRVTLIDIPGIEGNEVKYKHIISKALRKAHIVFYVHKHNTRPDVMIAGRIKEYLTDWARVCSIYNVTGAIGNYRYPTQRVALLTYAVKEQSANIQQALGEILGNLYYDNITLQAQIALCSSSNFESNERLAKQAEKLHTFFESGESAYQFSNFTSLVQVLEKLTLSYSDVILDSQKQKLTALKKRSKQKLMAFGNSHKEQLCQLEERLYSMKSDVRRQISSTKSILSRACEQTVNSLFRGTHNNINESICNIKEHDLLKDEIKSCLCSLERRLRVDIKNCIDNTIQPMITKIGHRLSEIPRVLIALPNFDFDLSFILEFDDEAVLESLKVSGSDVGDVALSAAGGVGIGAPFGPPGMIIGGVVGGILGVGKKMIFGDHGVGKAKTAAREDLDVLKSQVLECLNESIRRIGRQLDDYQRKIVYSIENEVSEIKKLNSQLIDLYATI